MGAHIHYPKAPTAVEKHKCKAFITAKLAKKQPAERSKYKPCVLGICQECGEELERYYLSERITSI